MDTNIDWCLWRCFYRLLNSPTARWAGQGAALVIMSVNSLFGSSPQSTSVQGRHENTDLVVAAFNGVATSIDGAFRHDIDGLVFSKAVRHVIVDELAEIRQATAEVIDYSEANGTVGDIDVSKILFRLHVIRGIMRQDITSLQALAHYEDIIALVVGNQHWRAAAAIADVQTVTGQRLPALLLDAIASLYPTIKLDARDVVLIKDFQAFIGTLHLANGPELERLPEELRMFVIDNRPPIYVVEDRPDMLAAIALYAQGQDSYLRYTFAAMLAHEWHHAFLKEKSETKAYAVELEFLREYLAKGLLPIECIADIEVTRARMLAAQHAEQENGSDGRQALPLRR